MLLLLNLKLGAQIFGLVILVNNSLSFSHFASLQLAALLLFTICNLELVWRKSRSYVKLKQS